MPDWLSATVVALPPMLWVVFGLGVPYALALLPRRDWGDRALVAMCALAFGPALLTAWMFVLGTIGMNDDPDAGATLNPMQTFIGDDVGGQAVLTPMNIMLGTVVLAVLGMIIAWHKWRTVPDDGSYVRVPLYIDSKFLLALIVVATLTRWVLSSFLLFGAWDPIWVYGYQAKIYTLVGYIPADIGYYPQFLPLQYAYTQILAGEINDHTARAVIPFLQIGSIFAAYVLGSRLFTRRTGMIVAALWALYPHFGYWTRIGDLEIPLTFAFTGSAAFFLMAWTRYLDTPFYRRRYALLAGVFFGVAMWTKPTAGAFVWGVVLVVLIHLFAVARMMWRKRETDTLSIMALVRQFYTPRMEVAVLTGLACIPLGALWYVRNLLIGLEPIVFPPSVWLTRAERSGVEFGWILLTLALLLITLYLTPLRDRPRLSRIVPAVALIALGVVPSIIDPHRMIWWEWLLFGAGWALLGVELWRYGRQTLDPSGWSDVGKLFWAGMIALPYFITWFYSYSYHYRLSFAIVPLLILPIAVLLARYFTVERLSNWRLPVRVVYLLVVFAVALPGTAIAIYDESTGWDWLLQSDDVSSQEGAAIIRTVRTIEAYIADGNENPVIVAPGVQRLPFYFPTLDIRVAPAVRDLYQLEGVDLFIDGSDGITSYTSDGHVAPFQNQLLSGIRREQVATRIADFLDPTFFYEIFDLHPDDRFRRPDVAIPAEREIIAGDFARFVGYTVSDSTLSNQQAVTLDLVWEVIGNTPDDYTTYVHLIDPDEGRDTVFAGWDGPVGVWDRGYYSTRFWEQGEYIVDRRMIQLPGEGVPDSDYRIRIGLYDERGRVPVTIDGESGFDGFMLETVFAVDE